MEPDDEPRAGNKENSLAVGEDHCNMWMTLVAVAPLVNYDRCRPFSLASLHLTASFWLREVSLNCTTCPTLRSSCRGGLLRWIPRRRAAGNTRE